MRASWTEEERAAFDRDDAADEALERARPVVVSELLSVASDPVRPVYRKRPPVGFGLGSRFGRFEVIGVKWRRRADGRACRCWVLLCGCGNVSERASSDFPRKAGKECRACSGRKTGLRSARLYGGKTAAELARIAGTTAEGIRRRVARGWTLEQLTRKTNRKAA